VNDWQPFEYETEEEEEISGIIDDCACKDTCNDKGAVAVEFDDYYKNQGVCICRFSGSPLKVHFVFDLDHRSSVLRAPDDLFSLSNFPFRILSSNYSFVSSRL